METVLYAKRGRVAYVLLNRPAAMNALNSELRSELTEAMEVAERDSDILAVVLQGAGGRAFSAGNDLKERAAKGSAWVRPGPSGTEAVYQCTKPTIAAIDGYCLAGGMQLAARCDIRIATRASTFGMPEPRRSLSPVNSVDTMETGFMPLGEAMWVMLTGSSMTAERAYDIGFVQALVDDAEQLAERVEWTVGEIQQCAPLALKALKNGIRLHHNPPTPRAGTRLLDHLSNLNEPLQQVVAESADRTEGPKAFAEKRAPVWLGR